MPPETAERAARAQAAWLRALERTAGIGTDPARTFPRVISELAETFGDAPALISNTGALSFRGLDARANQYARWLHAQGLRPGDVVGILMPNTPEYLAAWIGITRTGCIAALINTSQSGAALAHAITIVQPTLVIAAGADLITRVSDVRGQIDAKIRCWCSAGTAAGFGDLNVALATMPDTGVDGLVPPLLSDTALYIYTSGTTGLPKAARVSHRRVMQWSHWFAGMMDTRPTDRMYHVLPMYHAIGGVVATGAVLINGGSVYVVERFSARRFWDDVVGQQCTLFQYIGELCRYLYNSPTHPLETQHTLRLACGNGLSAAVWQPFQQRFQLPQILEYYAATEGTFSLYNCEGQPGAIGRIPPYLRARVAVALVRHDVETGHPVRGPDGHCITCSVDEAGEALGRVGGAAGGGTFEGYTDASASSAKILRDVFKPGDAWFRTGDLMRQDAQGFYYFVDRIGDTFRWKGENVSTTEVAHVLSACPGVADVIVYGVAVPGEEGRAGMAALVPGNGFDLAVLWAHMTAHLPSYARPVYLRIVAELAATGTFKPRKAAYVQEGYDPARVGGDAVYRADACVGGFVGV